MEEGRQYGHNDAKPAGHPGLSHYKVNRPAVFLSLDIDMLRQPSMTFLKPDLLQVSA